MVVFSVMEPIIIMVLIVIMAIIIINDSSWQLSSSSWWWWWSTEMCEEWLSDPVLPNFRLGSINSWTTYCSLNINMIMMMITIVIMMMMMIIIIIIITRPKPAYGRQSLEAVRRVRIQFRRVHFGVDTFGRIFIFGKNTLDLDFLGLSMPFTWNDLEKPWKPTKSHKNHCFTLRHQHGVQTDHHD